MLLDTLSQIKEKVELVETSIALQHEQTNSEQYNEFQSYNNQLKEAFDAFQADLMKLQKILEKYYEEQKKLDESFHTYRKSKKKSTRDLVRAYMRGLGKPFVKELVMYRQLLDDLSQNSLLSNAQLIEKLISNIQITLSPTN